VRGGGHCPGDDPRVRPDADTVASTNELSGVVHGPAIQARTILGGVHFGSAPPAPAQVPVPAQLPPAPAYFTGRVTELAMLRGTADDYDPVRRLALIVLFGTAGSGKTSLASHWLHQIDGDGVLFADLGGHAPDSAAPPGDVLTAFLLALGTSPDRIPLELAEQAKFYRSLTSGRRLLILLDDAATAAQVRALLPGPGPGYTAGQPGLPTLVVVTTRWRLTGLAMDGARFVDVGPLDDDSCIGLLSQMVGTERAATEADAIRTVVRLCAGLPLAVRVAGARLASHARWPVGRVAAELASEQDRLTALSITEDLSVRAAFDVSYQALRSATARVYGLLALIPAPDFGADLAAATAGLTRGQATGLLDELASASLLEETAEGRFRFHDLVKLHARERAEGETTTEVTNAIARAVSWYLAQAVAADVVIIPGRWRLNPMYEHKRAAQSAFAGPQEALQWLESELAGLIAAVRQAHDHSLHQLTWQLCEALWGLFSYHKYFRYWIQVHLLGIASARACGDPAAEARMRVQLGLAYLNLGRQELAREEFVSALRLDRGAGHRIGEATALENIGLADLSLGRPEQALDSFRHARAIFQEARAARGVMGMTRHIGEAYRDAGRHELAVDQLLIARGMAAALPDPYNEARSLTSLGQTHLKAGRPDEAVGVLREALTIMVQLGGRYEQARIHVTLAEALQSLNRHGQAREQLTAALAIYSAIDAPEAGAISRRIGESGNSQTSQ
jgi:tetratricopeptide (TPR) repeat protein